MGKIRKDNTLRNTVLGYVGIIGLCGVNFLGGIGIGFYEGRNTEYNLWDNNGPQMQEYLQENGATIISHPIDVEVHNSQDCFFVVEVSSNTYMTEGYGYVDGEKVMEFNAYEMESIGNFEDFKGDDKSSLIVLDLEDIMDTTKLEPGEHVFKCEFGDSKGNTDSETVIFTMPEDYAPYQPQKPQH